MSHAWPALQIAGASSGDVISEPPGVKACSLVGHADSECIYGSAPLHLDPCDVQQQQHQLPMHHRASQKLAQPKQERDSSGRWKPLQQQDGAVTPFQAQQEPDCVVALPQAHPKIDNRMPSAHPSTSDAPSLKRMRTGDDTFCGSSPAPGHLLSSARSAVDSPPLTLPSPVETLLLANAGPAPSLWELPPPQPSPVQTEPLPAASRSDDRRSTLDVETDIDHINDGYRCVCWRCPEASARGFHACKQVLVWLLRNLSR